VGTGAFARPAKRSEASCHHNSRTSIFLSHPIADPESLRIKIINRWDAIPLRIPNFPPRPAIQTIKWEPAGEAAKIVAHNLKPQLAEGAQAVGVWELEN